MSDRLAISASMSVLIMAFYVLIGADAARAPLSADAFDAPAVARMPSASFDAPGLLDLLR